MSSSMKDRLKSLTAESYAKPSFGMLHAILMFDSLDFQAVFVNLQLPLRMELWSRSLKGIKYILCARVGLCDTEEDV